MATTVLANDLHPESAHLIISHMGPTKFDPPDA
jgi:hypothetical protein